MKGIVVLIITVISVFSLNVPIYANNDQGELPTIDQMADEALYFAKLKRYEETKMIVNKMGELIDTFEYDELPLTVDEQRILRVAFFQAKKLLESDQVDEDDLIRVLTKFRLTTDALATEHDPLWFDMESVIMETLQDAKKSVDNKRQFQGAFQAFLKIYDTVYPGIILDVPIEKVKIADAQIQYLEQNADSLLVNGELSIELEKLQSMVQALFHNYHKDEADPSLWWVIISTGGMIILTLTYAGWKKYKGEKMKRKQLKSSKNIDSSSYIE
ncbi:sporulation protein YpjB [Fervidibacillus halotolerans]|uniref:Sporulation protein YpjB n=1 Tax=Fervidibacillus halotolerans TaxID=2980027 RepID=A0A9E8M3J7_9BACI|nr:sporulation protein YpjB [Fervidibacillus halotolerans]WAA13749.1 sporulation protein YpjB [Fervidibacillus halotolerans]